MPSEVNVSAIAAGSSERFVYILEIHFCHSGNPEEWDGLEWNGMGGESVDGNTTQAT